MELVRLKDLAPGTLFATVPGTYAVKAEYYYDNSPNSQCMCVLLATGEFAHFPEGNETLVRPFVEPLEDRPRGMTKKQLTEALADLEHRRWNKWTNYQFSKCEELPDGSLRIPAELVQRWRRQASTEYADLSESEKESDRHQVQPALPIIEAYAGRSE